MGEKHADRDAARHDAGGPGKSARRGHIDPQAVEESRNEQMKSRREEIEKRKQSDARPPKRSGNPPQ